MMQNRLMMAFALTAAALSQTAGAITATKEYVDRKDATNAAAIAVLDGVVSNHTEHLQEIDLRFETTPTLEDISGLTDRINDVASGFKTNVSAIVTNTTRAFMMEMIGDWNVAQTHAQFEIHDVSWREVDGDYILSYIGNGVAYSITFASDYIDRTVICRDGQTYLYVRAEEGDMIPIYSMPTSWILSIGSEGGHDGSADRFGEYSCNAMGFARLEDLPTNHVTKAELDEAINNITIPEIDTSNLATKSEVNAVSNEAQIVYRLFSGSNVVCEVTNYNSVAHAPELRLMQLNESNEYVTVWTETNGLARTLAAADSNTTEKVKSLRDLVATNYAPRAWSRTTSGLGAEAPSNTTWISTPTTVIAGGLEYAKVVHANGAVWVLSGNGMMTFDPTTNAYLRISADDGTDIFAIEKSDAVTVGAYAEGITVGPEDGYPVVVSIPVPVVSAEHPTAQFRLSLASGEWKDETEWNGVVGSGADVSWSGSSGAWVCKFFVMNSEDMPASAFFRFSYQQPGATVIRNGASVDVSAGGIMCTDGVHKCRPVYSNGSITWEVVP